MKHFLHSIPVPLSGLMLGVVALAKIFYLDHVPVAPTVLFAAGIVLFFMLLLKIAFDFPHIIEQLKNPAIASVAPTFTMGTMVISSILWLQNVFIIVANILWITAVLLHIILMIYFVVHFIIQQKLTLQHVLPSWFVTFVGMGMIPATAPLFATHYTTWIVWFAILNFFILLPFVINRVFVKRNLPIAVKPMITITAAPASLSMMAYLVQYGADNEAFVYTGLVVAQIIYFLILFEVQHLIKMPFYPSFGAFSFPLAVCATTLYLAFHMLKSAPLWLETLFYIELMIATIITVYVFIVYMRYLAIQTIQIAQKPEMK